MQQGMPPWEAYRWFDAPVETLWSMMSIGPNLEVAAHSVRRVVLMFCPVGVSSVYLSTVQSNSARGYQLVNGAAPLILTQQQHGVLCQVPWFAGGAGANSLTTIEVFLRAWPGEPGIG